MTSSHRMKLMEGRIGIRYNSSYFTYVKTDRSLTPATTVTSVTVTIANVYYWPMTSRWIEIFKSRLVNI